MGSQSRWGLTLPLSGLPLAAQQDLVTGLPELGYTDVWSAELNGIDGFTPLTLASQWAPRLRLGTAIVGIYTRAPVSLALQAGTLAALAPGKFVMGIGTSSAEAGMAITNWLAPKDVPKVRDAAGPDCELVARIFVCPTTDADTARSIGKRMVAAYLTVPVYAAFHRWLGRGDIIAPMLTAWNSGDRKGALQAIPDALVDELVIHGSAQECRERVAEYQAAGLDTPVIAIPPVPGLDLADTIRQLAPA